jgi:hypothetical protein
VAALTWADADLKANPTPRMRSGYAAIHTTAIFGDAALAVADRHIASRADLLLRRSNWNERRLDHDRSAAVDGRFCFNSNQYLYAHLLRLP